MQKSGFLDSVAYRVIKNVSNMLTNAPTRKTRLLSFTVASEEANDQWVEEKTEAVKAVIALVESNSRDFLFTSADALLKDLPACLETVKAFTSYSITADDAVTKLTLSAKKLREKRVRPRFAEMNATRWENSVYRCLEWGHHHLRRIAEFVRAEPRQNQCKSLSSLCYTLDTDEKVKAVEDDLGRWIDLFKPLADALVKYSDVTKPMASSVHDDSNGLTTQYVKLAEQKIPAAEHVLTAIKDEMGKTRVAESNSAWAFISRYCVPAVLKAMIMTASMSVFSESVRRANLQQIVSNINRDGVSCFQEVIWDKKMQSEAANLVEKLSANPSILGNDETSWLSLKETCPNLSEFFNYLVWLPPVVTGCDRLFSVETAIFAKNQGRTDPVYAGKMIACRLNGDVLCERGPTVYHWFGQQREVRRNEELAEGSAIKRNRAVEEALNE